MAKLQLVLENVRDRHMINILEEGTTELVALKTKKFLNENLSIINKILVEEGVVDGAKEHLANNWGKYAGGAAAGGTAAYLMNQGQDLDSGNLQDAVGTSGIGGAGNTSSVIGMDGATPEEAAAAHARDAAQAQAATLNSGIPNVGTETIAAQNTPNALNAVNAPIGDTSHSGIGGMGNTSDVVGTNGATPEEAAAGHRMQALQNQAVDALGGTENAGRNAAIGAAGGALAGGAMYAANRARK